MILSKDADSLNPDAPAKIIPTIPVNSTGMNKEIVLQSLKNGVRD